MIRPDISRTLRKRLIEIELGDRLYHFNRPTSQHHYDMAEWVASAEAAQFRMGAVTSADLLRALLWAAELLHALWADTELDFEGPVSSVEDALQELRDELIDIEIVTLGLRLANEIRMPLQIWSSVIQRVQEQVNFTPAPSDSGDTSKSSAQ